MTEFLPVSSSGHLILISIILGWQDQGLLMDIVAHAGSLIAVMIYFRREIRSMLQSVGAPASSHNQADKHLLASIMLATLPIMLAGVWLADLIELYLRDHTVIAISSMLFAIFLLYAWAAPQDALQTPSRPLLTTCRWWRCPTVHIWRR